MSHITHISVNLGSASTTVVQKLGATVTKVAMGVPGPVNNDVIRTPGGADAEFVTQAEYDALSTPRPDTTIYFIKDA